MLHRDREMLQTAILANIQRVKPGQTQELIGSAAGAERSTVSKWGSGDREMGLDHVVALVKEYGAVAVLGPIAESPREVKCDVVPRAGTSAACPRLVSLNATMAVASLASEVNAIMADGRVSREEEEALARKINEAVEMLHSLRSAARRTA